VTVQEILEEVITLPEAATIAAQMGYSLDRSNLLRYARSGRLAARKSEGTWLTTRSALQALILELAAQPRGRPRAEAPTWATFKMTPELVATLDQIDELRAQVNGLEQSPADEERLRRELTIEVIYHTNRIAGNRLSLPEVRAIVGAFWEKRKSTKGRDGGANVKDEEGSMPELLKEIVRRIRTVSDPEQIILFGSYARGDFGPDSDLDLLVIKGEVDSTRAEAARIYRALADLAVPIDVVVVRTAYVQRYGDLVGTVVRPALREGKVLYARR
jgi:predicted nucleotidyltransferase